MKIAVVSDIHSNYNALVEIDNTIENYGCELKICLGDAIGYYNRPKEVIEYLIQNNYKCVKGNHEKMLLGEINYMFENKDIYGIDRHLNVLDEDEIDFIRQMPDYIELHFQNKNLFLCHSLKDNCQVYMRNNNDVISNFNKIEGCDYYFFGHTHKKFETHIGGQFILNPGSVGQPRDESRPSFILLDTDDFSFQFIEVRYDVLEFIRELEALDYDKRLINIIESNSGGKLNGKY